MRLNRHLAARTSVLPVGELVLAVVAIVLLAIRAPIHLATPVLPGAILPAAKLPGTALPVDAASLHHAVLVGIDSATG